MTLCPLDDDEVLGRCRRARHAVARRHRRRIALVYVLGVATATLLCGSVAAQAGKRSYGAVSPSDGTAGRAVAIVESSVCGI